MMYCNIVEITFVRESINGYLCIRGTIIFNNHNNNLTTVLLGIMNP